MRVKNKITYETMEKYTNQKKMAHLKTSLFAHAPPTNQCLKIKTDKKILFFP